MEENGNGSGSLLSVLADGLIFQNPVLVLTLGTCPTLAVTKSAASGLGMGISAAAVLTCSNIVISLLRKLIPQKVRIPVFITIIAGFVTVVMMLIKAYVPELDDALGLFLPLIVVNCIILARAEMFASKNGVMPSAVDGVGMGLGFALALTVIGSIREVLGSASFFGKPLPGFFVPAAILSEPAGGFFVFGVIMALMSYIISRRKGATVQHDCSNCPVNCTGASDT